MLWRPVEESIVIPVGWRDPPFTVGVVVKVIEYLSETNGDELLIRDIITNKEMRLPGRLVVEMIADPNGKPSISRWIINAGSEMDTNSISEVKGVLSPDSPNERLMIRNVISGAESEIDPNMVKLFRPIGTRWEDFPPADFKGQVILSQEKNYNWYCGRVKNAVSTHGCLTITIENVQLLIRPRDKRKWRWRETRNRLFTFDTASHRYRPSRVKYGVTLLRELESGSVQICTNDPIARDFLGDHLFHSFSGNPPMPSFLEQ